jgi:DNA invertase Pin-like site-specific DNA recombinase
MTVNSEKVREGHLQRRAVVYVRQSTVEQLRHNHESRRRQYDLADQARAMGWHDVEVIDEDLGRSGASATGRSGFQRLVGAVGLREVGAVFSLEASRLARNNRDWSQLVDLCGLTDTLIVDFDGVYDARLLHDRLLLGLKGTMSEFELGLFRQRSQEALRQKASRGELFFTVPVGYVLTPDGRCEQDPDQRVRQGIATVFERFAESGSVRQVLIGFRQDGLSLPAVRYVHGARCIVWREATYSGIRRILANPIYAGAYAYGQRHTVTAVEGGRAVRRHGRPRPREEWPVLLPNVLPGYISWETYQRNQAQIRENATAVIGEATRGAAKDGPALLAGLLRCRRCGRQLQVRYGGSGRVVRYHCVGERVHHGGRACIAFGGLRVDQAVAAEVLKAVEPTALEAAVQAWEQLQAQPEARRNALELSVQQARYEAERAQRQFDRVEPENRLVAAELERRWNLALQELRRLEAELAQLPPPPSSPTAADHAALMALAHDLPAVWRDPATDMRKKKQLVRLLIREIMVDLPADEPVVDLVIHWAGGTHTQLRVRRYRTGEHRYAADEEVVDLVRKLAEVGPDRTIAAILNRLTLRTGKDNSWTETRVRSFRSAHRIPVFASEKPRAWLTMDEAAARLGVSAMTVHRFITMGLLPARQVVAHAPWMIAPADIARDAVQAAARAVQQGRRRPLTRHAAEQLLVPQDM